MYKVHHDATYLPIEYESPDYEYGDRSMPAVSVSASSDGNGKVHISLVNAHPNDRFDLTCNIAGIEATSVTGRILTAEELDAHNTFDEPDRIRPGQFDGASLDGTDKVKVDLPPRSVVVLELAKG
jgi:alpha-N-arabinofuranosidase